jgi:hypothetical protein
VISAQPVLTAGTIAGLVLAAWNVVVAQDALAAFVNLLVPIVAALLAARLVTPISAPNLPIGTVVNERSDAPTGVVTPE